MGAEYPRGSRSDGRFLQPGDVVEASIEGVGRLRNVVGKDSARRWKINERLRGQPDHGSTHRPQIRALSGQFTGPSPALNASQIAADGHETCFAPQGDLAG